MTPGRPVSVKLWVRDVDAAVEFYRAALGFRWNPDIWSFQFGEYPGDTFFLVSLDVPDDADPRPVGGAEFGFVVEDVDAAHRRALAAGGREWYPPQDNAGSPRSSGIEDVDGNRVTLVQA
jgi:predicted enzyme related to lactoylglutathione lyase